MPERRLKHLVDPGRPITYGIVQAGEDVPGGVPYIRPIDMSAYDGVLDPSALQRTSSEIAAIYRRSSVRPGEIVISIGPSFGKVLIVPPELDGANLTQGTARVTPSRDTTARYLYWALQSPLVAAFWDAAVGGATFRALNLGPLGETPVPVWPLPQQRVIADYLDVETARIDSAREVLLRANRLIDEWLEGRIEAEIWSDRRQLVPLMHLVPPDRPIQYGIVLPGPDMDEGAPIVKGGDVTTGRLMAEGLCRTTREIEAGYARSRLRRDDVVFAIRGAIGACASVPEDVEGANITQDVARISALPDVHPSWLLHALRSRSVQQQVEARIVGATIRGLNIRDLKRVKLPATRLDEQRAIARRLREAQEHHDELAARRRREMDLLQERRKAVITAAVTGQIEIPGAAA